jgi:RNA polymerase sigma factor (sigma-70 family)
MDRDAELSVVAGLRRGEPSAFDRAYDEYRPRLFSFLLRASGRREPAEEISQETWMRLATRAATLRDDTRLGPWLFTVARNLWISSRRTRRLEAGAWPGLERLDVPDDNGLSPEQCAQGAELQQRLEQVLARMPLHYREALLLVGVLDMDPARALALRDRARATVVRRGGGQYPWRVRLALLYRSTLEPVVVGGLSLGFVAWAVDRSLKVLLSVPGWLFR